MSYYFFLTFDITFLVCNSQNVFYLLSKSHVQHLVNFIKDNMFHLAEVQLAILKMVFDSTRCPNQNVNSTSNEIN